MSEIDDYLAKVSSDKRVGFRATAKGCSYYPFSGTTFRTLAKPAT